MINCYVSKETVNGNLKDTFYITTKRTFNNIPRHCIKIVIRNMNAQVRHERMFQKLADTENFHLESNNNGSRLVSFAVSKDLKISSTMFQENKCINTSG